MTLDSWLAMCPEVRHKKGCGQVAVLERYEWCEFWWDETGVTARPRVLLVGDSIVKGYKRFVDRGLKGEVCVDMLATSKGVDNPAFLYELGYMLGEHSLPHELIHFNNGLHGRHLSAQEYADGIERAIEFIRDTAPDATLILATSTPVTVRDNPAMLDESTNGLVVERNERIVLLAQKYDVPVNDLYSPMVGKPEIRRPDGYHYTEGGQAVQGDIVSEVIRRAIALPA